MCGLRTFRSTYASSEAVNLHFIRLLATSNLISLHIDEKDCNLVAINTTAWSILVFESIYLLCCRISSLWSDSLREFRNFVILTCSARLLSNIWHQLTCFVPGRKRRSIIYSQLYHFGCQFLARNFTMKMWMFCVLVLFERFCQLPPEGGWQNWRWIRICLFRSPEGAGNDRRV